MERTSKLLVDLDRGGPHAVATISAVETRAALRGEQSRRFLLNTPTWHDNLTYTTCAAPFQESCQALGFSLPVASRSQLAFPTKPIASASPRGSQFHAKGAWRVLVWCNMKPELSIRRRGPRALRILSSSAVAGLRAVWEGHFREPFVFWEDLNKTLKAIFVVNKKFKPLLGTSTRWEVRNLSAEGSEASLFFGENPGMGASWFRGALKRVDFFLLVSL